MKTIVPLEITAAMVTDTDVPEDDTYSAWSGATAYVVDDIVYVASTQLRYKCVQGHTNQDPTTDADNSYWSPYGAATRWRPFDQIVGSDASKTTSLYYEITPTAFCDGIALFGLVGGSVRIQIFNASSTEIHDETYPLVNKSGIRNFQDFITWNPVYAQSFIETNLPIYAGYEVKITVAAGTGSTAAIGEIVIGRTVVLGTPRPGTTIGYEDFSSVEPNEFGERDIVERSYAPEAIYEFLIERGDEERVLQLLAARRAKPTIFFTDITHFGFGTAVYGLPSAPEIVLTGTSRSTCRLTVEGLI